LDVAGAEEVVASEAEVGGEVGGEVDAPGATGETGEDVMCHWLRQCEFGTRPAPEPSPSCGPLDCPSLGMPQK
jgi:hypothetical protein